MFTIANFTDTQRMLENMVVITIDKTNDKIQLSSRVVSLLNGTGLRRKSQQMEKNRIASKGSDGK